MTLLVLMLLVVFQIKHFLADFPFQTEYMLGKFKDKGWELPLALHAAVHGLFTFLIATQLMSSGLKFGFILACIDFVIHFAMDRVKASSQLMGRWKPLTQEQFKKEKWMLLTKLDLPEWDYEIAQARSRLRGNKLFWWALGFDQMIHHLTHYLIIYMLVR
jgi:hypothetical protein